jgi:enamine deaminase RidA (YjgF/YER057c/UK114 family)
MWIHSWLLTSHKNWRSCIYSGTTSTDKEGNILWKDNFYVQAIQIIKNIGAALQALGASLKDVVRTRIYTTDINNWE